MPLKSALLTLLLTLLIVLGSGPWIPVTHAEDFSMDDDRTLEQIALDENRARPNFGVQLSGAFNGLGSGLNSPYNVSSSGGRLSSQAYVLEAEYQPTFLQTFGVLGAGPMLADYPTTGTLSNGLPITNNSFDVWAFGAQIRYQARYVDNQIVVPFVSIQVEQLNYSLANGPTGHFILHGGSLGLSFLLNDLDQQQALILFKNTGISRSYFFAEGTTLSGSDTNAQISGASWLLGLRCEF